MPATDGGLWSARMLALPPDGDSLELLALVQLVGPHKGVQLAERVRDPSTLIVAPGLAPVTDDSRQVDRRESAE